MEKNFMLYMIVVVLNIIIYFKIFILLNFEQLADI